MIKRCANKTFLNTTAVNYPNLVNEAAEVTGSANLIIGQLDAKENGEYWEVYTHGRNMQTSALTRRA